MFIRLTASNPCPICLAMLGIPNAVIDGRVLVLPAGLSPDQMQLLQDNIINHAPDQHLTDTVEQVVASDAWALLNAKLAAIPPVPGEGVDPYAATRARLALDLATALARANSLGGLA